MPLPLIIAHRAAHSLMRNAAAEGSGPPSYLSRNLVALRRIYQLCHEKKLSVHPKKIVPFFLKTTFEMSKITFEVFQNISNIILAFVRGLFFRWLWVTTSLYKNSPGSTACEDFAALPVKFAQNTRRTTSRICLNGPAAAEGSGPPS